MAYSFAEWKQRLHGYDDQRMLVMWDERDRKAETYKNEPNFHLAAYERMLQLCHMAIDLNDEQRKKLARISAAILQKLRESNSGDKHQMEIIENVVVAAEDYFQTYGTRTARYYMYEQGMIDLLGDKKVLPERELDSVA